MKKYTKKPFDIGLAKKITSGEVDGRVVTRDEYPAKILCFDARIMTRAGSNLDDTPIIALINRGDIDRVTCLHADGTSRIYKGDSLVVEVAEEIEHNLRPLLPVLVRDTDQACWTLSLFSHVLEGALMPFVCVGGGWRQCIPYEGNERLLGTTETPTSFSTCRE